MPKPIGIPQPNMRRKANAARSRNHPGRKSSIDTATSLHDYCAAPLQPTHHAKPSRPRATVFHRNRAHVITSTMRRRNPATKAVATACNDPAKTSQLHNNRPYEPTKRLMEATLLPSTTVHPTGAHGRQRRKQWPHPHCRPSTRPQRKQAPPSDRATAHEGRPDDIHHRCNPPPWLLLAATWLPNSPRRSTAPLHSHPPGHASPSAAVPTNTQRTLQAPRTALMPLYINGDPRDLHVPAGSRARAGEGPAGPLNENTLVATDLTLASSSLRPLTSLIHRRH